MRLLRFGDRQRLDKHLYLFCLRDEVLYELFLVGYTELESNVHSASCQIKHRTHGRTFEDVWWVEFVRVALFRDGDGLANLDEIGACGEVCDARGHDRQQLDPSTRFVVRVTVTKR